jgi:hypothetical protein
MANYYTLFANEVAIRKGKHNVEMVKTILDKGLEERQRLHEADDYDSLDAAGFDFEYTWDHEDKLMLHSEENGNVDHAIAFLEDLVKRNLVSEPVAFYWAQTCSSLGPGEFCGGGTLITKGKTYWFVPQGQVDRKWDQIKKERAKPKRKKR